LPQLMPSSLPAFFHNSLFANRIQYLPAESADRTLICSSSHCYQVPAMKPLVCQAKIYLTTTERTHRRELILAFWLPW
jgi:hypothetical protein